MSSASPQLVLAFDAYGTLLSTESIATQLATHFGAAHAAALAAKWRLYQLEYTWRLNSMGESLARRRPAPAHAPQTATSPSAPSRTARCATPSPKPASPSPRRTSRR